MDTLLQVGLSNAAVATGLALVAAIASRLWPRRPALVHGLWLLVLLKLVTPPLARVPVPGLSLGTERAPAPVAVRNDADPANAPARLVGPVSDESAFDFPVIAEIYPQVERGSDDSVVAAPRSSPDLGQAATTPAAETVPTLSFEFADWQPILLALWATGSAGWFFLAGIRLARFTRLLRHAVPAPDEVQEEADRIAIALGMRWCPVVQLLPGRLAPMVWAGLGKPRLLLPADLIGQLDEAGVCTLMAHELAHLRRGDHRVRLVEFLALGLFWWHPVVWIASRALREAEEQCCDAWVVAALPGASKTYATALMETLDFLSAAPVAPPLACGIGQVSDLKRRLTMIMRGATPRSLCWREGLAVLGLATLLPLLPTLARAEPEESGSPERAVKQEDKQTFTVRLDGKSADKSADMEDARAELKALEAELQKKLAEVREAAQRIKKAAEKIHHVEIEKARKTAEGMAKDIQERVQRQIRVQVDGAADADKMKEEAKEMAKELKGKIIRDMNLHVDGIRIEVDGKQLKGRKTIIEGPIEIEVTPDGKTRIREIKTGRVRVVPDAPPTEAVAPVPPVPPTPATPRAGGEAGRGARASARRTEVKEDDNRIDQLERKLEGVMRELQALRKEKTDSQRKEKTDSQRREKRPTRERNSDEQEDSI